MMSLEKLRKLEPKLADKSDEEVSKIRDYLYGLAELALESYQEEKKSKS